jgi:hypothetical protein
MSSLIQSWNILISQELYLNVFLTQVLRAKLVSNFEIGHLFPIAGWESKDQKTCIAHDKKKPETHQLQIANGQAATGLVCKTKVDQN